MTYKQSQYIATYFSMQENFVLLRQLKFKHAKLERYTVSLYWNPVISVYKKVWCGTIRGCGTVKIISRNKDETLRIVPQCDTIRGCGTNRVNMVSTF